MILRQSAFAKEGQFLKGGLHCHTTRSDGQGTPEEVIRMHVEHGYDFLALTDHRKYNFRNFTDLPITIIPGMEMDRNIEGTGCVHCFHTVCIGPVEGNGYAQDQVFESGRVKDQFEYQAVLDDIHAHHNLTVYCHPEWSGTNAQEFMHMKGNFAMEIWNSGCAIENHQDTNAAYWDELLFDGQHIWGVATDDGHAMDQHCRGWVCVKAENNVPAILKALENGDFYASTGPEIHDFYVEDGVAHIECSPVQSVEFISWRMPSRVVEGQDMTHIESSFHPNVGYLRASVIDAAGRRAWTNPIFF